MSTIFSMLKTTMYLKIKILILLLIQYVYCENPFSLSNPVTNGFGVQIHFTHPEVGELEMIRDAGFKWVRMDLFWEKTETQKGVYNFSDYDFLLSQLVKNNLRAYYILAFNNPIHDNVITESGRKAYAKWAATAVDHFKGNGIIWEIWNEPNLNILSDIWTGHKVVHKYIAMALEAMIAIREKGPKEIVVGPATGLVDLNYLETCFQYGLLNYWDGVTAHPYRYFTPETAFQEHNELKRLIDKYKPKGKYIPIVSGEWGYSAVFPGYNEIIQAKTLQRQLLSNVMHKIPFSIWYDWHNDGTNATEPEHHFGIVNYAVQKGKTPVYIPKDAYFAAKTMNTVLNGFYYMKRIATYSQWDYVLLFSNGKDLRLVVWTEVSVEHNINIPSDNCAFDIIHYNGSPVFAHTANGGSFSPTLSTFPKFIVFKGPNRALESAPEANFMRVEIIPIKGLKLLVRMTKISGDSTIGTITLTNIRGIDPFTTETKFEMNDGIEKTVEFLLKKLPENEITVGVKIERNGVVYEVPPHTYRFPTDNVINDCIIIPDGDPKIPSEQSLSLQTVYARTELGADLNVLKINYHFYGKGYKLVDVLHRKPEDRVISGQPKGFGFLLYGDSQGMNFRMRLRDVNHQEFQMRPEARNIVNWSGFRYVFIDIHDIEAYWGGPNDGVMKFPIEYNMLFMLENEIQAEVNSSISITAPVIMY